ncbi:MAG: ATPase domain-containing protein [Candidatus Aenigmatarchaeota archaeon]
MERVKTGIDGLDEALGGGIPKGNVILVSGSAGTGKTLLALSFIYYGATKFNEPGIFISTDQTPEEIKEQAKNFGWNLEELEKKDLLRLYHIDVTQEKDMVYLKKLGKLVKEINAKRIVIDSLTTVTEFLTPLEIKKGTKIFETLEALVPVPMSEAIIAKNILIKIIKYLKSTGCTCIVTSELPEEGQWLSRDTCSEFLTDGVILLRALTLTGEVGRSLIIRKMRYSAHNMDIHPFEITGKGIKVLPPEKGIKI